MELSGLLVIGTQVDVVCEPCIDFVLSIKMQGVCVSWASFACLSSR